MHISVLNGALWGMEHVHCGICELGQLLSHPSSLDDLLHPAFHSDHNVCRSTKEYADTNPSGLHPV